MAWHQSSNADQYEASPELTVLLLAFREYENLKTLLPEVLWTLKGLEASSEVLVVDGGSEDGTKELVTSLGARFIRQAGRGYGDAYRQGLLAARGRWVIIMDADHSHPPQVIPVLFSERATADLLVASRYVPGGVADAPLFRDVLSRILCRVAAVSLALRVRDASSGFRMYRREAILAHLPRGNDFAVAVEGVAKLVRHGYTVREIPFTFRRRRHGVSHVRLLRFGKSYLASLYAMWRGLPKAQSAPSSL